MSLLSKTGKRRPVQGGLLRQQSKRLSKSVREIGHEVEDEEEARVDANAGRMSRAQSDIDLPSASARPAAGGNSNRRSPKKRVSNARRQQQRPKASASAVAVPLTAEEEAAAERLEGAIAEVRAQVEEKNNLVEFFQKEIAKIQQVFAKVLDWDKAKRKKKSQLQGVDGAVDEEELSEAMAMAADLKAKGGSAEDGDAVLTRLSQLLFSHDVGASNFGQRRVKMLEAQIGKLGASQRQRKDLEARLDYLKNGPYNVVFHGLQPDWIEEEMADDADFKQDVLEHRVRNLLKTELGLIRDIPLLRVFRYMDGPRVGKAAPVVITFKNRKDKEQLMWRCKDKLRKAGILVTEDSQARLAKERESNVEREKESKKRAKETEAQRKQREQEEEARLEKEMEAWFD